jgi:hypothetical protein
MKYPKAAEPPLHPIDYQSAEGYVRKRRPASVALRAVALVIVGAFALLGFVIFVAWVRMGGWSGHI